MLKQTQTVVSFPGNGRVSLLTFQSRAGKLYVRSYECQFHIYHIFSMAEPHEMHSDEIQIRGSEMYLRALLKLPLKKHDK